MPALSPAPTSRSKPPPFHETAEIHTDTSS